MFRLWLEFGLLLGISVAATFLLLRALMLGLLRLFRRLTMGVRRSVYRMRSKAGRRRRRRRKVKQLIPQFSQIMAEYDESDTPQESVRPLTDEEAAEMFVEQVKAILAQEASRN